MPQREIEPKQPDVSAPPAWEKSPWQAEERIAEERTDGQPEQVVLADQNEHVIDLPRN